MQFIIIKILKYFINLNFKNANLAELQGDLKKRDDDLASLQSVIYLAIFYNEK